MRRGRPPSPDLLTPAEWQVVEAVRHGMTNVEIAARRGFSVNAVKFHMANVLAKLGLKNRAQLRHWPGVARASALASQEMVMGENLGLGRLGQISRSVSDIAAAVQWYAEVLGLKHLYTFGPLAFFDCGGTRLYLNQGEVKPESILYFQVADIRSAHQQLVERGVSFINAPHMIHRHGDGTEEWLAVFNDPDSRPLAIIAQVKPGV